MTRGVGGRLAARAAVLVAACCIPLSPLLAASPGLGGGEELGVSLGRIVTALIICVIVAVLAVLLIRQRSGKVDLAGLFGRIEMRPRAVHVVETRRLSVHADICLLRHDGREYLLLLMAGACQVLREHDVPGDVAPHPRSGR